MANNEKATISNKALNEAIIASAANNNIRVYEIEFERSDLTLYVTTNYYIDSDDSVKIANAFLNDALSVFDASANVTLIEGDNDDCEIYITCELTFAA